jgi:hypothetical protein
MCLKHLARGKTEALRRKRLIPYGHWWVEPLDAVRESSWFKGALLPAHSPPDTWLSAPLSPPGVDKPVGRPSAEPVGVLGAPRV